MSKHFILCQAFNWFRIGFIIAKIYTGTYCYTEMLHIL